MITYEVDVVSMFGVWCVTIGSRGMVGVLARVFYWFRGVVAEASATFGADEGGDSLRFYRREGVNDDIFDPVGMVTRTAAILVPIAAPRVEGQVLVHDWVGHLVAPQPFLGIIGTL